MMIGNVEGIILTHGSDTIQYTASFLSCIEEFTHIPVMVVCSNYVLTDNRANGLRNFSAAVDLSGTNAVMVCLFHTRAKMVLQRYTMGTPF